MSCDNCEITCPLIYICTRWNSRRDEVIDAVKRTIIDKELIPSVCTDSEQAEWSEGEAKKLAEAIVKTLAELEDSQQQPTERGDSE